MNISFYILTFNRPQILSQSINSLFANTEISPNEVWIIDDGSEKELKSSLLDLSCSSKKFPINLLIHGCNYGVGYSFERIFNLIRQNDELDIACVIESDYIWRKDWLKDCVSVFNACPNTLAIAGTDHPDMYNRNQTHNTFPKIMVEVTGKDLDSREYLYKPFDISTENGNINIQGVSNSCGCMIINWKRLKIAISYLEDHDIVPRGDFWKKIDRSFHKGMTRDARKTASDGWMTSAISKYGELYIQAIDGDISKEFPMVSISDFSISEHVCGGGINGKIVPEGSTFVISPKWKNEFLDRNPRGLMK